MNDPGVSWDSVLRAVREGWHGAGGGRAEDCPGCPVCRVPAASEVVGHEVREHLSAAVGHAVLAGRELLAALGAEPRNDDPGTAGADPGAPGAPASDPRVTGPDGEPVREQTRDERVRIHVEHDVADSGQHREDQA